MIQPTHDLHREDTPTGMFRILISRELYFEILGAGVVGRSGP